MWDEQLKAICRKLKPILGGQADSLWLAYVTAETPQSKRDAEGLIQILAMNHLARQVDDETILGRAEDASRNGLWVTVAPTTALKRGKSCWIDILSEEIGRFTVAGEVRHVAGRRVGLETTRPVPVARLENAEKD